MHRFEVWAPLAKKMAVLADGVCHQLDGPDEMGWWRADVESAGPGSEYGFLVNDDAKAYPDPRSLFQPLLSSRMRFAFSLGARRRVVQPRLQCQIGCAGQGFVAPDIRTHLINWEANGGRFPFCRRLQAEV